MSSSLPLLCSFIFCGGVSALSLYLGTYTYSIDDGQGPYRDTGFLASPYDWSNHRWIDTGLVTGNGVLTLLFCLTHAHRWSVLRRFLFIFGVAQLLQLGQMSVTRFPDPNVHLRNRRWCYTMHVPQYALSALFVQFYSPRNGLRVIWWAMCLLSIAVLVPTHRFYTVDVLSAVFASTAVFFPYHWWVRTTASIMRRWYVRWLEQDATQHGQHLSIGGGGRDGGASSTQSHLLTSQVAYDLYSRASPSAAGGAINSAAGAAKAQGFPGDDYGPSRSFLQAEDHEAPDDNSFMHTSSDDPRCDYNLEHFRSPSFAIDSIESLMGQLTAMAAQEPLRVQRYWPPVLAIVCGGIATGTGFLNLVAINAADHQRPLHIPLPRDVIFEHLPSTPAHTPDVLLYTQVSLCFLFALCSKYRFTIIRRSAVIYALLMGLRCFTVPATFPPDPSPLCVERMHPAGTTCGDLIFSGHTVAFTLSALVIRRYTKPMWLEAGVWAFTLCGLGAVVTSRLHYTRDVVTALYIVFTVYYIAHVVLFERVDRVLKLRWLRYLELDFYVVRAEDALARQEKRLPWHDWIGRFWRNCARASTLDPRVHEDP